MIGFEAVETKKKDGRRKGKKENRNRKKEIWKIQSLIIRRKKAQGKENEQIRPF
jgi:ribosomal protein L19E